MRSDVHNYSQRFPIDYPGYVFYKTAPRRTFQNFAFSMTFCNKLVQTQCQVFNPTDSGKDLGMYTSPETPGSLPKFVRQMNESIFERIAGVVSYNFGESTSGWLLFFNIDGRHKYCFTPELRDLSKEVRLKKQLIPNYYSEHYFSAKHLKI